MRQGAPINQGVRCLVNQRLQNRITMNKSFLFKIVLAIVCLALAGPELGIALEFVVLLDLLGIELFIFAISVPIFFYSRLLVLEIQKLDPYFFISPRRDVIECPALIAHAIPFFIVCLFFVVSSAVVSFFFGE